MGIMHIYFSGIGGTAIGPLAMIAKQAGYDVSGSDKQASLYIDYLKKHGVNNIHIGQTYDQIADSHAKKPIDWYVYSSAVSIEQPDAPELRFCHEQNIKISKRDELLNKLLTDKQLKLIAMAGTHGKSTTTAMVVWLFKQLGLPISYSVGAKISFGEMGEYHDASEYFAYEADEFDRNFLSFHPYMSLITGVAWDHHDIFPTKQDYDKAFQEFIGQSESTILWQNDYSYLGLQPNSHYSVLDPAGIPEKLVLVGAHNRLNGWLAIQAVHEITKTSIKKLVDHMNDFPGLSRRFEQLGASLYTDYAHTPEKVAGCIQMAQELSKQVVVVYEPLTNRRQHYIKEQYANLFKGVKKLYWVPSYLAREDPKMHTYDPAELIEYMNNKDLAEPAALNNALWDKIKQHRKAGDLVVCISGGGGNSLDEWVRQQLEIISK